MSGVEVHAMHWGYLLDEFAMSIMNKREDEYGGSLENRMRMAKEIVAGIKQGCGQDFPVMMRLGIKSYIKGLNKASFDGSEEAGRTLEEGVKICRMLEEYGYDALDLDTGIYDSFYYACPPSYIEQGYALDLYAQAKAAVKIPVIAGSRMQDPFIAEQAVGDGKIDGVLLSRPAMADAYLPAKVQMGRPEKIRPCIACCQCFARALDDDQFLTCAVNTTANKDSTNKLRKALISKKVVIVGGGVGGLEAARDAKLCGHTVELYEKSGVLGGLLNPAGAMSIKTEMTQLLEWYALELKELGVSIHLNSDMDAEKVKALNPDVVIIATGSTPLQMEFITGISNEKVRDCTEALLNKKGLGQKVAVIGGGNVGCEVAVELKRSIIRML
jgi:2-enoate reductase